MCGICGIASSRGAVDPDRLSRMSATLYHRGPDSEGAYVDGGIGVAARRLAIIDLATGDQPISNEDRRGVGRETSAQHPPRRRGAGGARAGAPPPPPPPRRGGAGGGGGGGGPPPV